MDGSGSADGPGPGGGSAAPPGGRWADSRARDLCRRWFGRLPCRLAALGAGGHSGQPVWSVEPVDEAGGADGRAARRCVLKAFGAECPPERAAWIHAFVTALHAAGIDAVPAPLAAPGGATLVADDTGTLWEMCPWRPGMSLEAPTAAQAAAALELVARMHVAAEGIARRLGPRPPAGAIPAWERRSGALARVGAQGFRGDSPAPATWLARQLAERRRIACGRLEAGGGRGLVARLAAIRLPAGAARAPIVPVFRDLWHAHVLFEGERVSGVIDPHAAGFDSPATDLARLLGSWRPPAPVVGGEGLGAAWAGALAAYEEVRVIPPAERTLVELLDVGGVIGGLDHWFGWVLEEGRSFADAPGAVARVDFLLEKLDSTLQRADALLRISD